MWLVVELPLPRMSVHPGDQLSPPSVLSRYWYRSTMTPEPAAAHDRSSLRKPPVAVKPVGVTGGGGGSVVAVVLAGGEITRPPR